MNQILQVSETYKETEDSRLISFDLPAELRRLYAYQPGQYITLEAQINGKSYRRPYSLCGGIQDKNRLSILVKRVQGGLVSNYLNEQVEVGTTFKVMPPQGEFGLKPGLLSRKPHVFFAAGCGITPIISMIEQVLKREMLSKVVLFYSNKTWQSTIFRERLKKIREAYPKRFQYQMIFTESAAPEARLGRLDQEKCEKLLNAQLKNYRKATYYLCGPTGFMADLMNALYALEVPVKNIKFESFGGELPLPRAAAQPSEALPLVEAEVEVLLDNERYILNVSPEQSILDSALAAELDANYSCRAGNCSSCKAKLISGQVHMHNSKGLSPKEIEEGYILTCQSQALSTDVKIEYCH